MNRLILPLFVLAAAFPGCGESGGDFVPVSGRVHHGENVLTTGSVSFRPDAAKGNKSLHHPTGAIESDGRFELFTAGEKGAPPGWYRVVIHATEPTGDSGRASPGMPKSIIPAKYNDPQTTPLAVEVVVDAPAGRYDLRLENEP